VNLEVFGQYTGVFIDNDYFADLFARAGRVKPRGGRCRSTDPPGRAGNPELSDRQNADLDECSKPV
jgi:hypothetical protein